MKTIPLTCLDCEDKCQYIDSCSPKQNPNCRFNKEDEEIDEDDEADDGLSDDSIINIICW